MKKVLLLLSVAFGFGALAQSTIKLTLYGKSYTISPNEVIHIKTKANGTTITEIDITNTGSTTNQYKVKRMDVLLNTDALAYFCFGGNCYTENIFTSPDADTLAPGQSASQLTGDFKILSADLAEGPTVGISTIEYTVFNVDVPSDKVSFTLKYNSAEAVSIKENVKNLSDFSIFPNPAKESAVINLNSAKAMQSSLSVYNALGEVVVQKDLSLLEGKNKIELNTENLKSGIYFVSIANGSNSISKKLIIN
jgi:hypothetical protein